MTALGLWITAGPPILALAAGAWIIASARRNVGLVDVFWPLFFLAAAAAYAAFGRQLGWRAILALAGIGIWSFRLALYLLARNWRGPEDRRYQAIRARHEPGFVWKSVYLVFGLQAGLAWLISAPLAAIFASDKAIGAVDVPGAALLAFGVVFEAAADAQLAALKADPANHGRVMDRGLWRYSRHPNYFGEFCVWWGIYFLALGAGAWWTLFSPLAMTGLLLRVSGIPLIERDIGERRPEYRAYMARTNAFFPGPRKRPPAEGAAPRS